MDDSTGGGMRALDVAALCALEERTVDRFGDALDRASRKATSAIVERAWRAERRAQGQDTEGTVLVVRRAMVNGPNGPVPWDGYEAVDAQGRIWARWDAPAQEDYASKAGWQSPHVRRLVDVRLHEAALRWTQAFNLGGARRAAALARLEAGHGPGRGAWERGRMARHPGEDRTDGAPRRRA